MSEERFLTTTEVAERLHCGREKARLIIMNEPGVVEVKAKVKTMRRIPESVLERIIRRSSVPTPAVK